MGKKQDVPTFTIVDQNDPERLREELKQIIIQKLLWQKQKAAQLQNHIRD